MNWTITRELAALTLTIVFIVDRSGMKDTMLKGVSVMLHRRVESFRPFTCSLCCTWWLGLFWLLIRGAFCIEGVAVVAILSMLTRPLNDLLGAVTDALGAVVRVIDKLLTKI